MNAICENQRLTMKTTSMTLIGGAGLLIAVGMGFAETGMSSHVGQIGPMRQDSLKVPSLKDAPRPAPSPTIAVAAGDENAQLVAPNSLLEPVSAQSYDPSGRRDPFVPVLQQLGLGPLDPTLPPLQRVGLTEMNRVAALE